MKPTRLLFMLLAVGMVALVGCGGVKTNRQVMIKQDTPRDTLETIAMATDQGDLGQAAEVFEPAFAEPMKTIAWAVKDSVTALEELARVVEVQYGRDETRAIHDAIIRQTTGKDKDRTAKLLKNGVLDDSKFDITVEGETATVTIKDDPGQPIALVRIDGKWYSRGPKGVTPESARKAADQMSTIINGETRKITVLTRKVKDGKLSKDKFAGEFAKIQVGF